MKMHEIDESVKQDVVESEKKGLYYYVNKRKKAGTSRDADSPKAPSAQAWKDAAKTAKKEGVSEMRNRRDAYQRDYDSSQTGFGRGHDHRGLEQELAHETNNIAIAINGKTWKVVPCKGTADSPEEYNYLRHMKNWAEKKSASSGKKWTVHLTGASVTESATAGATSAANVGVGAVYKNKPPKQPKNKDGTAKNALDINANLLTGGSIKR